MAITGNRYYEDFIVGDIYLHTRGRTVSEMDNHLVTHMTMNTAQGHFNKEYVRNANLKGMQFPERLVVGYFTMALSIGLSSGDISENAIADLGYTAIRNLSPVFHGDTLTAETEILEVRETEERLDAGIVKCKTRAIKQDGLPVWEGERTILVKKREYWAEKDGNA